MNQTEGSDKATYQTHRAIANRALRIVHPPAEHYDDLYSHAFKASVDWPGGSSHLWYVVQAVRRKVRDLSKLAYNRRVVTLGHELTGDIPNLWNPAERDDKAALAANRLARDIAPTDSHTRLDTGALDRALDLLSPDQRNVIERRYFGGETLRGIGPKGKVARLERKALAELHRLLSEDDSLEDLRRQFYEV